MTQQNDLYIKVQQFIYKEFAGDAVWLLPMRYKNIFLQYVSRKNRIKEMGLFHYKDWPHSCLSVTKLNQFGGHVMCDTASPLRICHREAQIVLTL